MSKQLKFIALFPIVIAIHCQRSILVLVDQGQSSYQIVLSQNASDIERNAADTLQAYLEKITGVTLPIVTDSVAFMAEEIIIGMNAHLSQLG